MIGRLVARFRRWFNSTLEGPTDFRQVVGEMRDGLNLQADSTSFAMARADAKYEELQAEVENHEGIRREAEALMRDNKEELAARAVALQIQSATKIERLKTEYAQLQQVAEQKVQQFKQREQTVKTREDQVPELEAEQRMVEMDAEIERSMSKFQRGGADRRFDQAERELRIRGRQLANKQLLGTDPSADLDRQIKEAVGQRKIDQAMSELRARISAGTGEFVEGEVVRDSVNEARQLLEAPRYGGLVQKTSVRQTVPVSRRLSDTSTKE